MLRRLIKRLFITLFLLGAFGAITVIAVNLINHATYAARLYPSAADVPADAPRVAIVFGAGLNRSGGPTPVLYDRVATAVDLYQRGLVDKLLLTGDNRFIDYNEPEAMRQTALQLGVPDRDLDGVVSRRHSVHLGHEFVHTRRETIPVAIIRRDSA
jgi:vancomycin permeability regulator SanA